MKGQMLQEFLIGLDKVSEAKRCFIFNPRKVFRLNTTKWLEIGDRLSHVAWNCRRDRVRLTFYTSTASAFERQQNEARIRWLMTFREAIEKEVGLPLTWNLKPGRGDQFVDCLPVEAATSDNRERWNQIQEDLIEKASRFHKVLRPYLDRLEVEERQALQKR